MRECNDLVCLHFHVDGNIIGWGVEGNLINQNVDEI